MVVNIDVEILLLPDRIFPCVPFHRRLPLLLSRLQLDVGVHFTEYLGVVSQLSAKQVYAKSPFVKVLTALKLFDFLCHFRNRPLLQFG